LRRPARPTACSPARALAGPPALPARQAPRHSVTAPFNNAASRPASRCPHRPRRCRAVTDGPLPGWELGDSKFTTSVKGPKPTFSGTVTLKSIGTAPLAAGNVSILFKDDLDESLLPNTTGCFPDLLKLGGPWATVAVAGAPLEVGKSLKVTFKKAPVANYNPDECHTLIVFVDTGCQFSPASPMPGPALTMLRGGEIRLFCPGWKSGRR
jgi:hypothetical protein